MSIVIDDSAFPAPTLVALSTLPGSAVFRHNGAYHQKATSGTAVHNLVTGDPVTVAAGTLVEVVSAKLVITAPVPAPVIP